MAPANEKDVLEYSRQLAEHTLNQLNTWRASVEKRKVRNDAASQPREPSIASKDASSHSIRRKQPAAVMSA